MTRELRPARFARVKLVCQCGAAIVCEADQDGAFDAVFHDCSARRWHPAPHGLRARLWLAS